MTRKPGRPPGTLTGQFPESLPAVRLPRGSLKLLRKRARKAGVGLSEFVRRLLGFGEDEASDKR